MTFTKKKDIQFRKCSVEGCENKYKSNGYCSKHVQAWRKYGNPLGLTDPEETRRKQSKPTSVEDWAKLSKSAKAEHDTRKLFDPLNFLENRKELSPEDCLIRLCRFCTTPMKKTYFEYDSDYRWYSFNCEDCVYYTDIREPIDSVSMKLEQGIEHEPLTDYEEETIGERKARDKVMDEQGVNESMKNYSDEFKEANK